MNNTDEQAFLEYVKRVNESDSKKTWNAACEYKDKEFRLNILHLKQQINYLAGVVDTTREICEEIGKRP